MAGRRRILEQKASRAFTGLLLVYTTIWDEAYTALCDIHRVMHDININVAAFSLAWSEANGINRRLCRHLREQGTLQVYTDYWDARDDQMANALTMLRIALKTALDRAHIDDSDIRSRAALCRILLDTACETMREAARNIRRTQGIGLQKILRAFDGRECLNFYDKAIQPLMRDDNGREDIFDADPAVIAAYNAWFIKVTDVGNLRQAAENAIDINSNS